MTLKFMCVVAVVLSLASCVIDAVTGNHEQPLIEYIK